MSQRPLTSSETFAVCMAAAGVAVAIGTIVVLLFFTTGCTTQPSCQDNPRNMRCMSAAQLEKELSK